MIMQRGTDNTNILDQFAIQFSTIIQQHTIYIIVSGYVAISSGRTRATEDIDMIIPAIRLETFTTLHNDLLQGGFVCVQSDDVGEIFTYLNNGDSVRYTRKNEPLPEMELKFAKDPLDAYQIATRTKLPLTGLDIWFSSIPVNIAFKEELLKSDKDNKDAQHLRKIYPELADEQEIKHVKSLIRRYRL